jgi:hypothetical protein
MTMTYSQFEDEFLVASVKAADAALAANPRSHGQVDCFAVAEDVLPGVNGQWVRSAAKSFNNYGWVHNLHEPLSGAIGFMVTGEGRRQADSLG